MTLDRFGNPHAPNLSDGAAQAVFVAAHTFILAGDRVTVQAK
jgi:hypothetical protein